MTFLIVLIVVVFVAGIVLFTQASSVSAKSRDQYLAEITKYLESNLEPIEGAKDAYRINFSFDGFDVIYEDYMLPGFRTAVNKAHIKIKQHGDMIMTFHEKTQGQKMITGDLNTMKSLNVIEQKESVRIPPKFKDFIVQTNNVERTNKLFTDPKFINLVNKFKNIDARGYLFMAFRLLDGDIILDLHNENRFYPSLFVIHKNLHLIEDPIKDAIEVSKFLKKYP